MQLYVQISAQWSIMKHIEILNSILEIYIAKLKLETAVIYSTDLKRTGHLFHLSLTL